MLFRSNLISVQLPSSLVKIGSGAFMDCFNLAEINIPSSVLYADHLSLANTPWFDKQSDGVLYIGQSVVYYKGDMPKDAEIILKDGTVSIGLRAFMGQKNLKSISWPASLRQVDVYAFANCTKLEQVRSAQDSNLE